MLPLGHLGFTLLAAELLGRHVPRLQALPAGWLLAGVLLPDAVDKPLAFTLLPGHGTRLFGHTLLFAALLAALALAFAARPRLAAATAALAAGAAAHLVEDAMWRLPEVLFWPLAGPLPPLAFDPASYLRGYATLPNLTKEAVGALALAAGLALHAARRRAEAGTESF